jgi:uncharacterized membrane protein YqiK
MKKYATSIILVGIIIILGAVLSGVLIYLKNQPPQCVLSSQLQLSSRSSRIHPSGFEFPE